MIKTYIEATFVHQIKKLTYNLTTLQMKMYRQTLKSTFLKLDLKSHKKQQIKELIKINEKINTEKHL